MIRDTEFSICVFVSLVPVSVSELTEPAPFPAIFSFNVIFGEETEIVETLIGPFVVLLLAVTFPVFIEILPLLLLDELCPVSAF